MELLLKQPECNTHKDCSSYTCSDDRVDEILPLVAGNRILEIGGGSGLLAHKIAQFSDSWDIVESDRDHFCQIGKTFGGGTPSDDCTSYGILTKTPVRVTLDTGIGALTGLPDNFYDIIIEDTDRIIPEHSLECIRVGQSVIWANWRKNNGLNADWRDLLSNCEVFILPSEMLFSRKSDKPFWAEITWHQLIILAKKGSVGIWPDQFLVLED